MYCQELKLWEQVHYCDEHSLPQSTSHVAFFMPHPTGISEVPDKNPDCLSFRSEFIMHNSLVKTKTPLSESASELYRPSDRRLLAK
jgi:hypothetical protein